jgi:membrane protease YdiL (CAAX protease family)
MPAAEGTASGTNGGGISGPGAFLPGIALPFSQAVLLLGAYSLGYPWLYRWSAPFVMGMRGGPVLQEALTLLGAGVLVALLEARQVRSRGIPGKRSSPGVRAAAATGALFLLGLLGLALRLLDPGFDDAQFTAYGLSNPSELGGFLAILPLGVAAEELVFRGCQKRLESALGSAPAVFAVAGAFALFHWVPGTAVDRHEIEALVATFAGGMVLAICYRKIPSVPLLIGVHLAYDYLAVAQAWLNVERRPAEEALLFALWIAGFGFMMVRASRRARRAPSPHPPAVPSPGDSAPGVAFRAARWLAALAFSLGLPHLLALVRLRLGF